ncbi:MAG: CPBP family intramembrane metalloprotease [bacterium]|nr:CPBP family intramembrane metalloprotease [bacterium]
MKSDAKSEKNPQNSRDIQRGRAGLLYKLIGPAGRQKAAEWLEPEELDAAHKAFAENYESRPKAERLAVDRSLRRYLSDKHGPLPMLLSLGFGIVAAALIVMHMIQVPQMSIATRSTLLTPLFLAVIAPLALYLLRPYQLHLLFRPVLSFRATGTAVLAFIVLLWTLYFLDREQGSHLRLDWFSQSLLIAGAFGAPLLEEIIFRELVPSFFGRAPHYFGHFIAMTAFAILHFPITAGMFALYFIAAFVLAEVRIQSDGLLYGTLAHALANITILLML